MPLHSTPRHTTSYQCSIMARESGEQQGYNKILAGATGQALTSTSAGAHPAPSYQHAWGRTPAHRAATLRRSIVCTAEQPRTPCPRAIEQHRKGWRHGQSDKRPTCPAIGAYADMRRAPDRRDGWAYHCKGADAQDSVVDDYESGEQPPRERLAVCHPGLQREGEHNLFQSIKCRVPARGALPREGEPVDWCSACRCAG